MNEKQLPATQESLQCRYEDEIDLLDIFNILWQRRWIIVCVTFIFVGLAFLYVSIKTPLYEINAQLAPLIRGIDKDVEITNTIGAKDIVAWFSGGAYRELFNDDTINLPEVRAKVISKSNIVRVFSLVEEPSVGLNVINRIIDNILKGSIGFFSQYSDIDKMELNGMIDKKENDIEDLLLQKQRSNTIDTLKMNRNIESAKAEIEGLKKKIDTIRKNKREVQKALELSTTQIDRIAVNIRDIFEQREMAIKGNHDRIEVLMYSNAVQQNTDYKNTLQQQILALTIQINTFVAQENDCLQEISRLKKTIEDSELEREKFISMQQQRLDLQIKKNYLDIDLLKHKLSDRAAITIVKYPTSSKYPVKPEKIKFVIMSFLGGLFISVVLSLFIHFIRSMTEHRGIARR